MSALEIVNLSKTFDKIKAVDDISFSVPEGSVFGLLGRNGAGKTTTIRMIMNIYLPDRGEVFLRGEKTGQNFKDSVGYLPEERGLYKKMKIWDTLLFFAELKGKTGREIEKKAEMYLKKFQLFDRRFSKVEDLSKGNQQKIQFIATLLHDPDFLILDEPFSGLDPINTEILKDIILDLKSRGKIIILCTHLMDFAERLCDNIALIHEGKIILTGALKDIKISYGKDKLIIATEDNVPYLEIFDFVESVYDLGNEKRIKLKRPEDAGLLLKGLVDRGVKINKFVVGEISLHEIFVQLTGDENARKDLLYV